jgi:hypothetical protein
MCYDIGENMEKSQTNNETGCNTISSNINDEWRRVDIIDIFEYGTEMNRLHQTSNSQWDDMSQCFWIRIGSREDIWLKLLGI